VICSLCNQNIAPDAEEKGNLVLIVPLNYEEAEVELDFGETKVTLPILKPEKAS
jgi:hypothetical protein